MRSSTPAGPWQPHPDTCRRCRDERAAGAPRLAPHYATAVRDQTDRGFVAEYRCERGHAWRTWWAWGHTIDLPDPNAIVGRTQYAGVPLTC